VVFVLRELKLGGEGLAVLGVSMAGGALLGASLTSRVVRLRGPIAVLTLAPFGYGLLMIVAAAPVGSLWLPAGAMFGYAIVSAMSAIAYVTFRQEAADQSAAGRVAAASRAITGGVFSLSAMGAVLLLTLLPARGVVWIAVLGETASVAILVLAGGLTHLQKPRDAGRRLGVRSGAEGERTDHRSGVHSGSDLTAREGLRHRCGLSRSTPEVSQETLRGPHYPCQYPSHTRRTPGVGPLRGRRRLDSTQSR